MAEKLVLEIGQRGLDRIKKLMERYGEADPVALISRAIGLLEAMEPYVRADGTLTVFDPNPAEEGDDLVDLIFEQVRSSRPPPDLSRAA